MKTLDSYREGGSQQIKSGGTNPIPGAILDTVPPAAVADPDRYLQIHPRHAVIPNTTTD